MWHSSFNLNDLRLNGERQREVKQQSRPADDLSLRQQTGFGSRHANELQVPCQSLSRGNFDHK